VLSPGPSFWSFIFYVPFLLEPPDRLRRVLSTISQSPHMRGQVF
jgi:hypothetical protein